METPFNERGVSVTRNALSAAGQVFPLRDIQGVRVVTVQKNKVLPWAISLIGAAGAIVGGVFESSAGIVCGVMLVVVGWLTWRSQDVTHRLMVRTGDTEREALSSIDLPFVERVAQTVRDARGASAASPAAAPKS
ncbi:hypothetical protein J8I87_36095 [Paraburkholderia sp. LEh10]|jgi:hypothetical protein|uniref:DUF6232 family protein n=1 Tax=Paraburkholderia sp. LEh10 TaxID=2821353 RepID=UPI001AE9ACD4|nr:DUF6232 family protein [Paraburkholderia sp. LEh10]MBP0594993.1 hypothetical protein [Paraburkholderia sp. LEh10]